MASYRYQRGDRPLEGYTIEHAVGRGGFGEVYYAVSDSGKQVALKAVQNHEDIELRGSTHCMNLKSPHLVTIFDVRHSERGDPFVIMEYVSGPSLRELLDDSPEGLGPEKSAWFIREISKAVSMLHDNGIVHRDLKPHNVFFEDGYVMVGDYSLSKVITTSHRSGHTLTVGTVHYMAPEISLGRYDRTVDIYAMGVLLYEMLTGKPPFLGESMGEVLMKHMSQEADVSSLPQPFAAVVQKAMARDPETRYQSADELVEALFGTDAVRDGASGFDPGSLTMIARRAVEKSRPMPATIARDSDAHKA
ncbi:MAG: serine/threonine protein kinase, partial [Planctomycetaceae bacterium]